MYHQLSSWGSEASEGLPHPLLHPTMGFSACLCSHISIFSPALLLTRGTCKPRAHQPDPLSFACIPFLRHCLLLHSAQGISGSSCGLLPVLSGATSRQVRVLAGLKGYLSGPPSCRCTHLLTGDALGACGVNWRCGRKALPSHQHDSAAPLVPRSSVASGSQPWAFVGLCPWISISWFMQL